MIDISSFNWGETSESFKKLVTSEIFEYNVYERIFSVTENDVVLDIGASIGPFTYSILNKRPKHVFCLEPSFREFKTLVLNTNHGPVTCINKGISSNGGMHDCILMAGEQTTITKSYSITLSQLVSDYNLKKIDLLKTDCEGGEYDLFNDENLELLKKIPKIVGEWHLNNMEQKEKFRVFRDKYLPLFENFHVYSVDGVDIKWDLWNEHFIEYYQEVIIHIDNRESHD